MSAGSHGAGCGVVLGIILVLLAQQFAFLSLSDLVPALEDLILGAVLGGILGGLIGWALGRRYLRNQAASAAAKSAKA
jgi:membrane protein YqaA with SNARE-associated domain